MAARYWVGGSGNWDGSTTHWSDTSGGAGGFSIPTAADDVYFDALSHTTDYTVTLSQPGNCLNINFTNPASGTLTFGGTSNMNVYGNFTIFSTIIWLNNSVITFIATTTGKTITLNSVVLSNVSVTFNGNGGEWTLQDTFNIGGILTLTAGTLITNNQTVTCGYLTISGALTRTLTLGSSTINATGWTAQTATNLTFNANTSTIALSSVNNATYFNNLTYNIVTFSPGSSKVFDISGATFATLTITGGADDYELNFTGNFTVSGTLTINGNSNVYRLLIASSVNGTARTLTAAAVSMSYVDIQDITGAGAGSWNLSSITGGSGDCGGNTNITFTSPTTQHWIAGGSGGGSWSEVSKWTSRIPLPQDDVIMDLAFGTSQTVYADMPRMGKNIDWSGATWTTSLTFNLGGTTQKRVFGSITYASGMTNQGILILAGRSSYTLTAPGINFNSGITVDAHNGTYTLGSNLTTSISYSLTLTKGTFTADSYSINAGSISTAAGTTLNLGTATHYLTVTGTVWTCLGTLNAQTSTIIISNTQNFAITFAGNSKVYNNVWFDRGSSTSSITISGNNTFGEFKDTGTAAHSILFTTGTTQTFSSFVVRGNPGALITITSTTTGTHALIMSKPVPAIQTDYLNIQHSIVTPTNTWFAGNNSVNNQSVATGGSGWLFCNKATFRQPIRPGQFKPGFAR